MRTSRTFPLASPEKRVVRLGMGCWAVGGHGWGPTDDQESIRAIRHAVERGIDFFDTADVYGLGHSEHLLAEALGARKHEVVIATKGGVRVTAGGPTVRDCSASHLRSAAEASLRRLRVDALGLYYAHWPDGVTPVEGVMETLLALRAEGKVRAIGLSNFPRADVEAALACGQVDALQLQMSVLEPEAGLDLMDVCERHRIALVPWGALGQGLLTGKYSSGARFDEDDHRSRNAAFQGSALAERLAAAEGFARVAAEFGKPPGQLALAWLLESGEHICPLFGAKSVVQVEENVGALEIDLDPPSLARIREAVLARVPPQGKDA